MPAKKQQTPTTIDLTCPDVGGRQQITALIERHNVGMRQLLEDTEALGLLGAARSFIAIAEEVTARRARLQDKRIRQQVLGYLAASDSGVSRTTAPSDPEAVEEEQHTVRRVLSFLIEALLALHVPLRLERTFDVREEWLSFAQGNRQGGIFRLSLQGFVAAGVSRCSESITGTYPQGFSASLATSMMQLIVDYTIDRGWDDRMQTASQDALSRPLLGQLVRAKEMQYQHFLMDVDNGDIIRVVTNTTMQWMSSADVDFQLLPFLLLASRVGLPPIHATEPDSYELLIWDCIYKGILGALRL